MWEKHVHTVEHEIHIPVSFISSILPHCICSSFLSIFLLLCLRSPYVFLFTLYLFKFFHYLFLHIYFFEYICLMFCFLYAYLSFYYFCATFYSLLRICFLPFCQHSLKKYNEKAFPVWSLFKSAISKSHCRLLCNVVG